MPSVSSGAGRPPWRLSITGYLTLGLGGLMAVAIATTLWLALGVALRNTEDLLDDKGRLLLGGLRRSVEQYLGAAEGQVAFIAGAIESGSIDPRDRERLFDVMHAVLAATPQSWALVYFDPDGTQMVVYRDGDAILRQVTSWVGERPEGEVVRRAADSGSRQRYWGAPVYVEQLGVTVVNLRRPLRRDGAFAGVIASTVTVADLSEHLIQLESETEQNAFILYDRERVLAHRALAGGFTGLSKEEPLPRVSEVGDPVLGAIWKEGWQDRRLQTGPGHHAEVGERDYIFIYDELERYGRAPWLIGSYFPEEQIGAPYIRLVQTALVGVLLLLIAVAAALLFGRALRRPVMRLADAAEAVRALDLEHVPPLRRSRFRELDSAAAAFNAMVAALRAFALYIPHDLVARLIDSRGDVGALRSETREVTIMFTDIAAFTTMTERLGAGSTATLLNEHFDLLTRCVEAEAGTVDKFLGDGVMALWNAVEMQPDHPARAVRAAVRIAAAVRDANAGRAQPLRLRIGVHSGPVVVGNIGSRSRMNYTVVGDPVNAAERLQNLGKDLLPEADVAILLSAATRRACGDDARLRSLGWHRLRGRDEPTEVFTLDT